MTFAASDSAVWHALHLLTDYPVLTALAREGTQAVKLDGRACRYVYEASLARIDGQPCRQANGLSCARWG